MELEVKSVYSLKSAGDFNRFRLTRKSKVESHGKPQSKRTQTIQNLQKNLVKTSKHSLKKVISTSFRSYILQNALFDMNYIIL